MNPLNTALTNIRRSPFQSLTAVVIIAVTLLVGYVFSMVILGAHQILGYLESRPQAIGFFQLDVSNSEINAIGQEMLAKDYVTEVEIVTQEEALQIYRDANSDKPQVTELVTADILPASVEVSTEEISALAQVKSDLEGMPEVDEVVLQEDLIDSLSSWTSSMRNIGIILIIVMGITSFLVIMALVSMKVTHQKKSIQIMKFLGANSWFVQAPYFFEGVIYGLVGSFVGWLIMFVSFLYLTPWLKDFLGSINILPVPAGIFAIQFSLGTLIAMSLGGLAGSTAVKRMMR